LYYQDVPEVATPIDILYGRKPVPMTDSSNSFPDGLSDNQDFEDCIVNYAIWRMYRTIEDAAEGPKRNTAEYKLDYYESLENLKNFCSRDVGPETHAPASELQGIFTNY